MTMNQLMPFNKRRFDACMAFISQRKKTALTKYQMVKLHVLIDLFHTLKCGSPVIGGPVEAWKDGAVVNPAYMRLECFNKTLAETGKQPEEYEIVPGKYPKFIPTVEVDEDDFSEYEIQAMEKAWDYFVPMMSAWGGFRKVEKLFHDTGFLGRAWAKARGAKRSEIDWGDVIDAYDAETGEDHSKIKQLMQQ